LAILQSGLGAGISATAFHRHAISTTIVEIDPAVYDAARTFFGLPDPGPGKVFLEDVRSWAATKRASVWTGKNETLYDFIVHDCFSGGGVPEHIFTLEFWNDLQTVLHPEGVVVVVRNRTIRCGERVLIIRFRQELCWDSQFRLLENGASYTREKLWPVPRIS
jgi:spermidine synthase